MIHEQTIRQVDGDLSRHWYIGALSREITREKPTPRTLYGKHYAFFRDSSGTARVVEDRCLHRGAQLSLGKCDGDYLRCPYHGWAYDGQGAVADIPSEGKESPELKRTIAGRGWKIASPAIFEQDGVVWIWMGEDSQGKPTEPNPVSPPWRFPFAEDSQWTSYFMVTDFENEVTHLAQNFMDVPHTVFVHAKWFRDKAMIEVPYRLESGAGRVKATYQKPSDSIGGFMGRIINPESREMAHTDEFVFPQITRVDYRFGEKHGFIINSQCTPVSRFQTRVYTWIAYRGNWLAPLLKPFMRFYTRQVIEQDVQIMQNQGVNLRRYPDRKDWKSTSADEIHIAITRMRELGIQNRDDVSALPYKTSQEKSFWI